MRTRARKQGRRPSKKRKMPEKKEQTKEDREKKVISRMEFAREPNMRTRRRKKLGVAKGSFFILRTRFQDFFLSSLPLKLPPCSESKAQSYRARGQKFVGCDKVYYISHSNGMRARVR